MNNAEKALRVEAEKQLLELLREEDTDRKKVVLYSLLIALRFAHVNCKLEYCEEMETVVISFYDNAAKKIVNVAGDSPAAMLVDIFKQAGSYFLEKARG